MPYTPTDWVNLTPPPISAANLDKIEAGILAATRRVDDETVSGDWTISGDWTHTGVAIFNALKLGMGIRNAAEYDSIQDALDDLPA